jgi:hypothetical protein
MDLIQNEVLECELDSMAGFPEYGNKNSGFIERRKVFTNLTIIRILRTNILRGGGDVQIQSFTMQSLPKRPENGIMS